MKHNFKKVLLLTCCMNMSLYASDQKEAISDQQYNKASRLQELCEKTNKKLGYFFLLKTKIIGQHTQLLHKLAPEIFVNSETGNSHANSQDIIIAINYMGQKEHKSTTAMNKEELVAFLKTLEEKIYYNQLFLKKLGEVDLYEKLVKHYTQYNHAHYKENHLPVLLSIYTTTKVTDHYRYAVQEMSKGQSAREHNAVSNNDYKFKIFSKSLNSCKSWLAINESGSEQTINQPPEKITSLYFTYLFSKCYIMKENTIEHFLNSINEDKVKPSNSLNSADSFLNLGPEHFLSIARNKEGNHKTATGVSARLRDKALNGFISSFPAPQQAPVTQTTSTVNQDNIDRLVVEIEGASSHAQPKERKHKTVVAKKIMPSASDEPLKDNEHIQNSDKGKKNQLEDVERIEMPMPLTQILDPDDREPFQRVSKHSSKKTKKKKVQLATVSINDKLTEPRSSSEIKPKALEATTLEKNINNGNPGTILESSNQQDFPGLNSLPVVNVMQPEVDIKKEKATLFGAVKQEYPTNGSEAKAAQPLSSTTLNHENASRLHSYENKFPPLGTPSLPPYGMDKNKPVLRILKKEAGETNKQQPDSVPELVQAPDIRSGGTQGSKKWNVQIEPSKHINILSSDTRGVHQENISELNSLPAENVAQPYIAPHQETEEKSLFTLPQPSKAKVHNEQPLPQAPATIRAKKNKVGKTRVTPLTLHNFLPEEANKEKEQLLLQIEELKEKNRQQQHTIVTLNKKQTDQFDYINELKSKNFLRDRYLLSEKEDSLNRDQFLMRQTGAYNLLLQNYQELSANISNHHPQPTQPGIMPDSGEATMLVGKNQLLPINETGNHHKLIDELTRKVEVQNLHIDHLNRMDFYRNQCWMYERAKGYNREEFLVYQTRDYSFLQQKFYELLAYTQKLEHENKALQQKNVRLKKR